jgi:hypothetical protein
MLVARMTAKHRIATLKNLRTNAAPLEKRPMNVTQT